MPHGTDLTAAGDQLQSCASRMAEWINDLSNMGEFQIPYEVRMAAIEAPAAVVAWTRARTESGAE